MTWPRLTPSGISDIPAGVLARLRSEMYRVLTALVVAVREDSHL